VWLENPEGPEAKCISCGRKEPLIRQCVFAGVGSTKTNGDAEGRVWSDPHTISDGEDVLKPGNALGATDAAAGQWARAAAAILGGKEVSARRRLWIVSFATVQNDKYLEAVEYEIPFPNTLDDRKVQESAESIRRWQKEGWKLVRKATPRNTVRKHLEVPPVVAAVRAQVEAAVSKKAGQLISQGDDAWEQAAREYRPMMTAVAKSLSPGYTTVALRRRREIAAVKPDMRPETQQMKRLAGRGEGTSDSNGTVHRSPDTPEVR
jgi:hypothetical protein